MAVIVSTCARLGTTLALARGRNSARIVLADAAAAPDIADVEVRTGRDVAGDHFARLASMHAGDALAEALAAFIGEDAELAADTAPTPIEDVPQVEALRLDRMADATKFSPRLRALFARAFDSGEVSVPPLADAEPFKEWLSQPDPDPALAGVSRFLADVYRDRPDLREVYPDLTDTSVREGYLEWASIHGADELPMPAWLIPRPAARAAALVEQPADPVGVNVVGYFQSELGVGEAARRVVRALDAAYVPLMPVQGTSAPPSRRGERGTTSASTLAAPFDVNLICINADGLPAFAEEAGPAFFDGRYTIGMWWWELPDFPDRFQAAVGHVDEIWVGTRYVRDAIAPRVDVPVTLVRLPVEVPVVEERSRADLELPDGFLAYSMFDFNSVMGRKNPIGLIAAFARAFAPGDGAALVIKCINGDRHPEDERRLRAAAAEHPHVELLERYVSAAERDTLLAACDVYVSLHRSEGFGLTLAEAMALGRAVIATDYSGSSDFLDDETGWPVPYTLVPVGTGNEPYPADGTWADPDLDAAAAALREVREHSDEAARRGSRAAQRITDTYAPTAAGGVMAARLEALRSVVTVRAVEARRRRAGAIATHLAAARERTAVGPSTTPAESSSPAARRARAATVRLTRPAVENERVIHRAMLDGVEDVIGGLVDELAEVRIAQGRQAASALAAQRELERRLRVLEARLTPPTG